MVLDEIYEQTRKIEQLVDSYDRERRDEWITQLKKSLQTRGRLIRRLDGANPPEDRTVGDQIVAMNRRIDAALQSVRQEIARDMSGFRQRKQTVSRYRNPYTGPTKDGMYLDKKK